MNDVDTAQVWIGRLLRVVGALLIGTALAIWVTPVNALGQNLIPVGCGSPASPDVEPLADFICRDHLSGAKSFAVSLAIAAGLLLLISEFVIARMRGNSWVRGAALVSVLAIPVFAVSTNSLFTKVASNGADGTLIRCGTPMAPATDVISKRLCGDLADRAKIVGLAGMGLSLLTIVGAGYVAKGARPEDAVAEVVDTEADPTPDPDPSSDPTREGEVGAATTEPGTPGPVDTQTRSGSWESRS